MPFPKLLARFNKYVINRFILLFAGWIPPFAIITHRGRVSDRSYRTPILAFPYNENFIFALTYGRDVDWVKNLLAYEKGSIKYNGSEILLYRFQFIPFNEVKDVFPTLVQIALYLIEVFDCLQAEKYTLK